MAIRKRLRLQKAQLDAQLSGKLFMRIRGNLAFHYAEKMIDCSNLKDHLKDRDTFIFVTASGYHGDMLSHISTLAMIDPLIGFSTLTAASREAPIDPKTEPYLAYARLLEEVIGVGGLYLTFVSEALTRRVIWKT